MKAILVDDELAAIENLELLLQNFCDDVSIIGKYSNVLDALKGINANPPDILFLDIEMPSGTGFDILESIKRQGIDVIFVTAYDHYAIKAIQFEVQNYLLKPIDVDELIKAIDKIKSRRQTEKPKRIQEHPTSNKLKVATQDGFEYLDLEEITHLEADGSYTIIHMIDKRKMHASKNLKFFEGQLEHHHFARPHASFVINLKKVKKYIRTGGDRLEMDNGAIVPISRRKRDEFMAVLDKDV